MCLSFKRILIIGTQKGEKRLKMNKKIYYCWLSIERRLYLVCQAKRQRHHLLYVGVVMSSCSPLVMLLMGINAIIWLLIQISLRIQSEQTHRRSMGVSAVTGSTLSSFCKCLAQQKKHTHINIIVLLEAEEDLIICRGNVSKHACISVGAQTNLKNMSCAEKKWKQGCCTVDAVQNQEAVKCVAKKKATKIKRTSFLNKSTALGAELIFLSWMNSGKREAFDLFSATDISLTVCGQISFKRRYRLH